MKKTTGWILLRISEVIATFAAWFHVTHDIVGFLILAFIAITFLRGAIEEFRELPE